MPGIRGDSPVKSVYRLFRLAGPPVHDAQVVTGVSHPVRISLAPPTQRKCVVAFNPIATVISEAELLGGYCTALVRCTPIPFDGLRGIASAWSGCATWSDGDPGGDQ